jgi:hypothetical protein
MARDTRTGQVLEAMVLPSLVQGGYSCQEQTKVGRRPNGGRHFVDVLARKDGDNILISLKWQQVSGTAEQKVPYEVICLIESIRESNNQYDRAYIVLGGPGWSLRDYYTSGDMNEYLRYSEYVSIMTLEDFIARANMGTL